MSILRSFCPAFCLVLATLLPAQEGKTPPPTGEKPVEAAATRSQAPAGLAIGVVDLAKAFDLYPRTARERDRLGKLSEQFLERLKATERRAEEVKGLIPSLKEGSPEQNEKILEFELLQQTKRAQAQMYDEEMKTERNRMQLAIYQDLEVAVKQLAKDKGLHLVLRIDSTDGVPADAEKPNQLIGRVRDFEIRQVLFAAEHLDLTPALIKILQVPLDPPKGGMPPSQPGDGKEGK